MIIFFCVAYYLGILLTVLGVIRVIISFNFYFTSYVLFVEWEMLEFYGSRIIITLIFDWIRLMFIGLVFIISSIVLFYRTLYIKGDKLLKRFIYLVYLFVISMAFLILSPNLIRLLLGWDGLGLISYCLVIYYQNTKSANAGILTILSNRVGDVALLLRIAWILNFGSWNFFYLQYLYRSREWYYLGWLIIIAAITKRAQIPFSAWLPAAMAAPTPVSALVHSSTLVTAGVYLLIRFHRIIGIRISLFYIGRLTIFISGLGANLERDLKKIIALSTLSQLGLIIIAVSLRIVEYAFFHLITHAIFKSLLFLCAGVYIHSIGDTQDIRHIRGFRQGCPITSLYFIISSMALMGLPFLSGFYSKDIILEIYLINDINVFIFIVIIIGTFFTVSYSIRLYYLIIFNNLGVKTFLNMKEEVGISLPMGVLLILTVIGGGFIRLEFFPVVGIFIPVFFKLLIIIGVVFTFVIIFYFMKHKFINSLVYINFKKTFLGAMWGLPIISTLGLIFFMGPGTQLIKSRDQGWIEFLGGQGLSSMIRNKSTKLDYLNHLNAKIYLFIIFISLFIFFLIK